MSEHLTFDTLNEFVDDALSAGARSRAAAHIERCAECRHTVSRLRSVIAAAPGLRQPKPAPPQAWPTIQARIEQSKHVSLPYSAPRQLRRRPFPLAAAVVLFVASAALLTFVALRRSPGPSVVAVATPSVRQTTAALPADFAEVERRYLVTARELEGSLNEAEAKLPTETVQQVRANLGVIDSAITEVRSELVRDPANNVMRDILGKSYEQKLDFLRRASALSNGAE
jgi:anti-sigma factor RsiW